MPNPSDSSPKTTTRREFIHTGSAATLGTLFALPIISKGKLFAQNQDTLKVGLIGCGGRGTGAASQALNADPNVVLTAMADAFPDRLQGSLKSLKEQHRERVAVDQDHQFVGFDAYERLIASGVDVVLLATPPGFRPLHLEAAVNAGKHVFCEKPMAVDAPGVRKVLAAAETAKQKKLSLVAGFCWRYNYGERAIMDRIHNGAIGDLVAIHTVYNTGALWVRQRQPEWTEMEYQMRNWYYFAWLSGDHIAEQACHSIDKMAWAMGDVPPAQAVASGGRQVRMGEEHGHIYDHFSVVFDYANGVKGFHDCRQWAGCASDNSDTLMGTKGVARINAFGPLTVQGENKWKFSGERPNMYQVEHNELFASIRSGNPINDGKWMAHSTLTSLMGRMAAYTGQVVTWENALNSNEDLTKWVLNQEGKEGKPEFSWDAKMRIPEVARPGLTRLA